MAIPALARDFKEFLKSLNSNGVEYLLILELFLVRNNVVRMGVPPIRIEVLTSISGVEFEACYAEKEMVQIEEIVVPVISLARLRENKAASGRAKDLADLESLS